MVVARFQFIAKLLQRCFVWSKDDRTHLYNYFSSQSWALSKMYYIQAQEVLYILHMYISSLWENASQDRCA